MHDRWGREDDLVARTTADDHRIEFGLSVQPWRDRPRLWAWSTLAALLLLTLVAYKSVRRLLRPLDDIVAGARRFGSGDFRQPIPVRRHDELGELAGDVNAMARSIHQMLEAKRALLLAISHELRSPITRARLHVELLPEQGEAAVRRTALLRELQEMADLVTDLLESERLGQGHAALNREPTDLGALVREVIAGTPVVTDVEEGLPPLSLDRARIRRLLRNLMDNALHRGAGVDEAVLPQLAEPFYRPDVSRERATGGVGLALYRLVAQAHGAEFVVRNARPGLEVTVTFDAAAADRGPNAAQARFGRG